ncbi:DUF2807 domain-containing protein [bacterium]|nr:DUF2807 domain-containing protein [bacterium]
MPRPYRPATLAALLLIAFAAGPAGAFDFHGHGHGREGSGDLETRSFALDDFDEIIIGGAFAVDVRLGDDQDVAVTVDDNLWDLLEVTVDGGRLRIDWTDPVDPDDDCRIAITARRLVAMGVSGAGEVRVHDFRGDEFAFKLSGAAELEMDGEVDRLVLQVSGAGDIDTRDLRAKHVKVRISGAGNANITATESLDAEVSGVGNIDYWGDPAEKHTRVSGLGDIDAH